jgi:hypothetical protein
MYGGYCDTSKNSSHRMRQIPMDANMTSPAPPPFNPKCAAEYGQCGGDDTSKQPPGSWTGPTCCQAWQYCHKQDDHYSGCVPNQPPSMCGQTPVPSYNYCCDPTTGAYGFRCYTNKPGEGCKQVDHNTPGSIPGVGCCNNEIVTESYVEQFYNHGQNIYCVTKIDHNSGRPVNKPQIIDFTNDVYKTFIDHTTGLNTLCVTQGPHLGCYSPILHLEAHQ